MMVGVNAEVCEDELVAGEVEVRDAAGGEGLVFGLKGVGTNTTAQMPQRRRGRGGGRVAVDYDGEGEAEEKDAALLLNFTIRWESCSGGVVGAQKQWHRQRY